MRSHKCMKRSGHAIPVFGRGRLAALTLMGAVALCLGGGCGGDDDGGPAPDTTPPAAVADLSVAAVTDSSATLEWEAPGDNGTSGTASEYDIRYATSLITEQNWSTADSVAAPPTPQAAGSEETFTVDGLSDGTLYYFALKTVDDASNWSELSNVASDTTGGGPPEEPLLVISPVALEFGSEQTEQLFTITNEGTGTLAWTVAEEETWLTVSPGSGSTTTEADDVTVTVSRAGLDPGDYTGTVTVTPGEGDPEDVTVTMSVAEEPPPGEMVYVSAGTFTMGSDSGEGYSDEHPEHTPYISAFYIDTYEVTNAVYASALNWAMGQGLIEVVSGDVRQAGGGVYYLELDDSDCRVGYEGGTFYAEVGWEDHPVVEVSWYGAAAYCNWRSGGEGRSPCYDTDTWECNWQRPASC